MLSRVIRLLQYPQLIDLVKLVAKMDILISVAQLKVLIKYRMDKLGENGARMNVECLKRPGTRTLFIHTCKTYKYIHAYIILV